ncbi:MAG: tetratricopeptide repeat protein [Bradymonadia bacterium]
MVLPTHRSIWTLLILSVTGACQSEQSQLARPSEKAHATPIRTVPDPSPKASAVSDAIRAEKVAQVYRPIGPKSPGPEVCADCHPDVVEGFLKTGMGRSLYAVKGAQRIENFAKSKATIKHPVTGVLYRAFVDEDGRFFQEESLPETGYRRVVEASHIIGSGNHTRSYLGTVDGELVELPLTWYSERGMWDMSPGYERANHQRFSRPVKPICLFCHNDPTPTATHKLAMYERPLAEGISCARCHGEGSGHVAAMSGTAAPSDPSDKILNPKKATKEKQLQICQQCHLAGEARVLLGDQTWSHYDPRQPLADFMSLYVYKSDGGAEFGIASHGHRLALSACAKASGDKMTCTTCHNPHRRNKEMEVNGGCKSCHQPDDCGQRHEIGSSSCSSCHMHKGGTSDIPHVTFTDHFIRKNPAHDQAKTRPDGVELVDILARHRKEDDPRDAKVRLGIAHARIWRLDGKQKHLPKAMNVLQEALKARPQASTGWEELAMIYKSMGRLGDAKSAFENAEKAAGRHNFRIEHAETLEQLGDLDGARKVLESLTKEQPDDRAGWGNLGNILFRLNRIDDARKAYEKSNQFGPSLALTASNRGYLELKLGRFDEAEKHFNEALKRDGTLASMQANLGTLALARGAPSKARTFYRRALKRDPKFTIAHWLLGRIEMDAKDWKRAEHHFESMIALSPNDVRGYLELSELAHRRGQIDDALRVLLRAQSAMPHHPLVLQRMMQLRGQQRAQTAKD